MTNFKLSTSLMFLYLIFGTYAELESCSTPNGELAECISLYECTIFLKALATQDPTAIEFVKNSTCERCQEYPMVCCGTTSKFTIPQIPKCGRLAKIELLPDKRICGLQHTDDRVYNGYTAIDEFPWMALLKYKFNDTIHFLCGGTLISARYVVTAAHCILELPKHISITGIRLGEYNINEEIDCVNDTGVQECADPVLDVTIDLVLIHPSHHHFFNDIALLRLNQQVVFTDYIRPICLPITEYHTLKDGDILTSSGWGSNKEARSNIKKRVKSILITNEDCEELHNFDTEIMKYHMCSVGTSKDFVCDDDSGGPIMSRSSNQWFLDGIISYDTECKPKTINIHTRISTYIDWILDNISP